VDSRNLHLAGFPWSVRNAILEADGHRCRRCGATEDLEVAHIKPIHCGGENTFENGQTLCHECRRLKSRYDEWIKPMPVKNLLNPHPSSRAAETLYYVAPGIWNATKRRWEHYGPFHSYQEAWEWVEGRWQDQREG
jgi:hypothetical protein